MKYLLYFFVFTIVFYIAKFIYSFIKKSGYQSPVVRKGESGDEKNKPNIDKDKIINAEYKDVEK